MTDRPLASASSVRRERERRDEKERQAVRYSCWERVSKTMEAAENGREKENDARGPSTTQEERGKMRYFGDDDDVSKENASEMRKQVERLAE